MREIDILRWKMIRDYRGMDNEMLPCVMATAEREDFQNWAHSEIEMIQSIWRHRHQYPLYATEPRIDRQASWAKVWDFFEHGDIDTRPIDIEPCHARNFGNTLARIMFAHEERIDFPLSDTDEVLFHLSKWMIQ